MAGVVFSASFCIISCGKCGASCGASALRVAGAEVFLAFLHHFAYSSRCGTLCDSITLRVAGAACRANAPLVRGPFCVAGALFCVISRGRRDTFRELLRHFA